MTDTGGDDRVTVEVALVNAFTPAVPIREAQVFKGRFQQIRETSDAILMPGTHAAIYGDRGVGKTSLANVITELLVQVTATTRINCSAIDTFSTALRRSLAQVETLSRRPEAGYRRTSATDESNLSEVMPEGGLDPDLVAGTLAELPLIVLIVDEFDRLPPQQRALFADLIKALSDRAAAPTVVLVGVATDVTELVANHASIARCMKQIHLPRMTESEIVDIIDGGVQRAGFTIDEAARQRIVAVAHGFPYYAHLAGLYGCRAALDTDKRHVTEADVLNGLGAAAHQVDATLQEAYHKAITGTRPNHQWVEVVAACARCVGDERGYFSSRQVQDEMGKILGRPVIQQAVAQYLGKLIEESRGPLLERIGPQRRYRYRFVDPLMQPFVLMCSATRGL